ncbi:MAG: HNH endonuclease [Chloroflexota bacterium]
MPLPESQRQAIFDRADHLCEYCHTSRRLTGMPLVVNHILPRVLDGGDEPENLCAACYRCNEYKGAPCHRI